MDKELKIIYGVWIFIVASFIVLIPLISSSPALINGLVPYYKLDETAGATAVDSHSAENLTNTDITINQAGKIGTSYANTETGNDLYTNAATSITGNFSINFWAYRTASPSGANNNIIEQGSYTSNTGFGIWINANSQLGWRIKQSYNNYKAAAVLPLNNWAMVTLVYNGSTIKIYVNATEKSTESYSTNPAASNIRCMFQRSENHGGSGESYYGRLDEVGIWNKALNTNEIAELYNSGNGFAYPFVTDTCTCPGLNQNWAIAMSDYCNITTDCNLGTGTLSFTGSGWCKCNATVTTTNLGDPGSNNFLYIQNSCTIYVKG